MMGRCAALADSFAFGGRTLEKELHTAQYHHDCTYASISESMGMIFSHCALAFCRLSCQTV